MVSFFASMIRIKKLAFASFSLSFGFAPNRPRFLKRGDR